MIEEIFKNISPAIFEDYLSRIFLLDEIFTKLTFVEARSRRERYPGTHPKFENLGTAGYRTIPIKF